MILGYPSLKNKIFGNFLGEIHRINPEILGYPRIPGSPLTPSLYSREGESFFVGVAQNRNGNIRLVGVSF